MIEGSVEPEALQKAVDGLLARHETLRTFFYEDEGELLQAISAEAVAPLGFTDLSKIAESDRDHVLQNLMREQARQPFDLSQAPLVRFHFFRLTEQRHVVFFNIHHIIADRRSLNILKEELILLYKAAVLNQPAGLPNLPVQYADYAIWAAKYLSTTGHCRANRILEGEAFRRSSFYRDAFESPLSGAANSMGCDCGHPGSIAVAGHARRVGQPGRRDHVHDVAGGLCRPSL